MGSLTSSTGVTVVVLLIILAAGLFLWKEQQEIDVNASVGGLKSRFGGLQSSVAERLEEDAAKIESLTSKVAALEDKMNKLLRGTTSSSQTAEEKEESGSTSSPTAHATKATSPETTTTNDLVQEGLIVDHMSCSEFKPQIVEGEFTAKSDKKFEMVRLGATDACEESITTDLSLFFIWQESGECSDASKSTIPVRYWTKDGATASSKRTEVHANLVGCFTDDAHRTWRFFGARLGKLLPETVYLYGIQGEQISPLRELMSPPLASSTTPTGLVLFGDTQIPNARAVIDSLGKLTAYHDLVIHVGDGTYATNNGECWADGGKRDAKTPCGWDCSGPTCTSSNRMSAAMLDRIRPWVGQFDSALKGGMVWMTTMGNHDNDLHWFLSQRPTISGALPGVKRRQLGYDPNKLLSTFARSNKSMMDLMIEALSLMKQPHFYSFDHGKAHVISIGSEDNPNNAYEQHNGQPLTPELLARFEAHYGPTSPQYKWLEEDLKRAQSRRSKVPWVILFTHRPLFHTSSHHPNCGNGGDWYVCLFRETYEPLFKKYSVNVVASGHSHHYSRSKPMNGGVVDLVAGTVHTVVGTGGYELTNRFSSKPEWLAVRQGTSFGFVHLVLHNATHARWRFMAPLSKGDSNVEDETWIVRQP